MAQRRWNYWQRFTSWFLGGFVVFIGLSMGINSWVGMVNAVTAAEWPPMQVHPLPKSLEQWRDRNTVTEDYFTHLEPLNVGALIWSSFPVRIYVEPPSTTSSLKPETWQSIVAKAIADWQPYLPLDLTDNREMADITIRPSAPPLQIKPAPSDDLAPPRRLEVERVQSAETRYRLYLKKMTSGKTLLIHRCAIDINPRQAEVYLRPAVTHELGHALGLWGHSPNPQDTMYFAQVSTPTGISQRDVATLLRVYQQPTRLGWYFP